MSQDFVTTLQLQLREAAEREARRGPLRRALPQTRPLMLAAALAAAAAVIALAVGTLGRGTHEAPATKAPQVVARLAIADQGGTLSAGFGSLWSYDNTGVLRLGPDGALIARIPIRGDINDAYAGSGAMWALTDDHLYRIDPKTNDIVARIPLPPPSRSFTGVFPADGVVYVANGDTARYVDLKTNRIGRRVDMTRGGEAARGFAGEPGRSYMLRRDGLLETLDARTLRRIAVARPETDGLPVAADRGRVVLQNGAGLASIDASTGKQRWRTNLGTSRVNGAIFGNGALWVQGTPVSGTRDQLWKLDPNTGRVLAALPLSDFGVTGMTTTPGRLWIMSSGGTLTAIA
jgi:outer membrane protein assembly factor BamB